MFCTLSTTGNKVGMIRHERKSQVGLVIMSTVPCVDQMDTPVLWWFLRKLLKSNVRGWMLDMMLQPRCDSIKALFDGRNCLLTKWQRGWWVFLEPLFTQCGSQLLFATFSAPPAVNKNVSEAENQRLTQTRLYCHSNLFCMIRTSVKWWASNSGKCFAQHRA